MPSCSVRVLAAGDEREHEPMQGAVAICGKPETYMLTATKTAESPGCKAL